MSLFLIAAGLLGLLWGSFLNVVIHRLPKTAAAGISNSRRSLLYLAWPWSFCPQCEVPIKPWHNIPLISYLFLSGKSSCCKQRISVCYPLIEIAGAVIIFAAIFAAILRSSLTIDVLIDVPIDVFIYVLIDFLFVFLFLSFLLVVSVIDLRRYCLLDILTLPLLWLGLLANLDARFALINEAVLGAIAGYLSLALLVAVVSRIIGPRAMGGGDPKLFAALGAWLGWQMLPFVLFIAAVAALFFSAVKSLVRGRDGWKFLFGLCLMVIIMIFYGNHFIAAIILFLSAIKLLVRGRVDRQIVPFGPCLSVAAVIMLFYGEEIVLSYWDFVLR